MGLEDSRGIPASVTGLGPVGPARKGPIGVEAGKNLLLRDTSQARMN